MIPHGWGQAITGRIDTSVDFVEQNFTIKVNNKTYVHNLNIEKQIKCSEKQIRQYDSCKDFLDNQNFIKGQIIKTLTPKYLFCDSMKGSVKP